VLLEVLGGVDRRPGFDESDVDTQIGEDLGYGSAAGSGTDDGDVINLRTGRDLQHG
jgi:hypothetical protein